MVNVSNELIARMARQIVREVNPERIVLFGSWGRGEGKDASDVDLLVVEREPFGPNRSRRQEAARIWRCLAEFRVPKDILVCSVDEVAQWQDSAHHVIAQARREGRVLYESSMSPPDAASHLLALAQKDFKAALILAHAAEPQMDNAGFHLQKAVEKSLKA